MVRGRVQGVGFRFATSREGRSLHLAGWVRNLPDGAVEVTAEGDTPQLESLVAFLRQGPRGARVTGVDVSWEARRGDLPSPFEYR